MNVIKNYLLTTILLVITIFANAQTFSPPTVDRTKIEIGEIWKFSGTSNTLTGCQNADYNDSKWQDVKIPHTWNSKENDSLFSNCWYRVHVNIPKTSKGKQIYLYFEAVRNNATVDLNGKLLGMHRSGMTAFIFDATEAANIGGDNVLSVMVNTTDFTDCLPACDAYITFGGIYRNVWLITTNNCHIDNTDFASGGVYISQTNVSKTNADVSIKNMIRNNSSKAQTLTVRNYICDKSDKILTTLTAIVKLEANSGSSLTLNGNVSNPILWEPANPYLHKVYTEVEVNNKITDCTLEKTGFRYYKLTDNDFVLNGTSQLLRGANIHMENEDKGTAFEKADHEKSWDMAKDLGFNFVRLCHYPRAQYEYELGDSMGIMCWTENGSVTKVKAPPTPGRDNVCREFVRQAFNHPSIFFWGCGNEVADTAFSNHYAKVLATEDPTRPIVYASNGQNPSGCIVARNTYPGWYGKSTIASFPGSKIHFISESGAGSAVGSHQDYKAKSFKIGSFEPEEYAQQVIEYKYEYMYYKNPTYVPMFTLWQMKDASDPKFKGQNSKGLATNNYFPKDIYYFVRTFKTGDHTVHLCGKTWNVRFSGNGIKAYSNAASLTLKVNNTIIGTQQNGVYAIPEGATIHNVFYWADCLQKGKNAITVTDENGNTDSGVIYYMADAQTVAPVDTEEYVTNLSSSNNVAVFVNTPILSDYPVYYQCDGTADNTFKDIPAVLKDARKIATARVNTNLSFTINSKLPKGATVYYMTSGIVGQEGFTDSGITGKWRDNNLNRVSYKLFMKSFAPGEAVSILGSDKDNVTLLVSNI